MGTREAADALGVRRENIRKVASLPEPVQVLACGSIWLADDIRAYAERRDRLVEVRRQDGGRDG
jgi:hypothetical protein